MQQSFEILFMVLQYGLLFFWAYWFLISVFGFGKAKKIEMQTPSKRFLIMIPSHNEEAVIGNLVSNLKELDYPNELYEICVIADNCNDDTAKIARKKGAKVIEHFYLPGEPKGKPYGIKYAVDQYGNRITNDFDALVIFDADNLVSLNYLKEMNNHLLKGEKLIQCYLDSKNPADNLMTLGYAASYYYMNRTWQLAKYRLGLGNAVGGTGFCVDTKLFTEVGWTATSLTEDLEFTIQCALKGEKATWSHHARIYDEKPEKLKASMVQRLRWSRGHWDILFRYSGKLMKKIVKGDALAFDSLMYLLNPAKIILEYSVAILMIISFLFDLGITNSIIPLPIWVGLIILQVAYLLYCLSIDTKTKYSKIKGIIALWFFNLTYVPLMFWALLTMNNKEWNPTQHTKSVDLESLAG